MAFFRSEPMSLCQIILHNESAFNCLIELGYLGKVQFYNTNPTFAPLAQYKAQVARCNELTRMLHHLEMEIEDFKIKPVYYPDVDVDEVPQESDLKELEKIIQEAYEELTRVELNIDALRKQRNIYYEHIEVLEKAQSFLSASDMTGSVMAWSDSIIMSLLHNELRPMPKDKISLSFLTGTVPVEKFAAFELVLWRVTMGNYLMRTAEFDYAKDDQARKSATTIKKYVFMLFFVGENVKQKILKICQGFEIKLFDCPESAIQRQSEIIDETRNIAELDEVLQQTQAIQYRVLLIASADFYIWKVKIKKMLMVYHALNRMGQVRHLRIAKYLQSECWIPTKHIPEVRSALMTGVRRSSKGNPTDMFIPIVNTIYRRSMDETQKPTHFALNRFTKGFQNLVDSYGIAQYQELNPAPYTVITFPFLFGIMFGDSGHGFIMFLFGFWMCCKEKALEEKKRMNINSSEIFNILFAGRYIITMMGAFSIYTGLVYNVCFSRSVNMFGSAWRVNFTEVDVGNSKELQLDPARPDHYRGTPYEFGVDPIWGAAGEHAIITSNSFKMKLAVVLGILQMIFGLILSAINFVHKKEYMDFFLIFVPQFMFLLSIFGYLVFMIAYKWTFYGGHEPSPRNAGCAPSILIAFINMLLLKGPETPAEGCDVWMYEMQHVTESVLLTIAVICVPVLLAGKPIAFILQQKRIRGIKNDALRKSRVKATISNIRKSLIYNVEGVSGSQAASSKSLRTISAGNENVGELWIHSGIHCIESVLGAVSHTASYLRLWALSLAHDQLSTVLWNMVLDIGLSGPYGIWNSVILAAVFAFWAVLTVAILVVMEGLSAFLHCLRLHWVEFQSKFYAGSGEIFTPFVFPESTLSG